MGKAVSRRIRRVVDELLEMYGDRFTADFDKNKEVLRELGLAPPKISKYVRNVIAGRITRIKKKEVRQSSD